MRILYLTQVFPFPPDAGPKIRIYYMLRYLGMKHQVTLVSFIRDAAERDQIARMKPFLEDVFTIPLERSRANDIWHLTRSLMTNQPFLIARDENRAMTQRLRQAMSTRNFQAVHADQLSMAQYAANLSGIKKTLDEHNAVWTIVQRMWQNERRGPLKRLQELEWRKMRRYENAIVRRFDNILTVTEEDKTTLQDDSDSPLPISVIPICIDVDERSPVARDAKARDILFIGGMFYPPNVDGVLWFAREVFPIIRLEYPDTNFVIVGARPDAKIVKAARDDPHIRVTGYASDTEPYIRDSAAFVVPLRAGGGMRVKILDAWARGLPIVSTNLGCEGMQVRDGENILVADTPAAFAHAVVRILRDRAFGDYLAECGRRWVKKNYDWQVVYQKLDEIYSP